MGAISGLKVFKEKGQPGIPVSEAEFTENLGMNGDRFADGGDRQVTLLAAETVRWMKAQEQPGLCFKRYKANIETEDFDITSLKSGDQLEAGEAVFQVSGREKRCFPECALWQSSRECRLSETGIFLKVIKSGRVCAGDEIRKRE